MERTWFEQQTSSTTTNLDLRLWVSPLCRNGQFTIQVEDKATIYGPGTHKPGESLERSWDFVSHIGSWRVVVNSYLGITSGVARHSGGLRGTPCIAF